MLNLRRLTLGLFILVLGCLVYVVDRPPGNLSLITEAISLYDRTAFTFGSLGYFLPAFAHVFAFCLLTGAFFSGSRAAAVAICAGWFLIDAAFEIGQHNAVWPMLQEMLPSTGAGYAFTQPVLSYLRSGRFDPEDLIAIGIGAITAYLALRFLSEPVRIPAAFDRSRPSTGA